MLPRKHAAYPVSRPALTPLETQVRQQSAEEAAQAAVHAEGDTLGARGEAVDDEGAPLCEVLQ